MKAVLFSFTRQASRLSLSLLAYFQKQNMDCISYTMEKYATDPDLHPFAKPLKEIVSDVFEKDTILIFISACGIAVRSIAPFVKDKTSDPCVLVIDEKGQFVISLLSGHLGGGNLYASQTAAYLNAVPVISTATDLNQCFSVDSFAKANHLALSDMNIAKKISSCLLDGTPVGIDGNIPCEPLPEGVVPVQESTPKIGFSIQSFYQTMPYKETLFLIPKQVVLGIGCKKNTKPLDLQNFVKEILSAHSIFKEAIAAVTSIELKKEETALIELAKHYNVPFITYDTDTLNSVNGSFSGSDFVKKTTGVDNVCERASIAFSHADSLYLKKTAKAGMTIAISLLPVTCHF